MARILTVIAAAILAVSGLTYLGSRLIDRSKAALKAKTNFITFSKIDKAQNYSKGEGVKVAVCDWLFDLRGGDASKKYTDPVSIVPGESVGSEQPWHGEWMAEMVHQTAPACKIIPIRARAAGGPIPNRNDYQPYLIKGIRLAADQGAVAVTSSMGPLTLTDELRAAVDYAEAKGTLFINVHPINGKGRNRDELDQKIIYPGLVSVPWHRGRLEARRDIYVWPYALTPTYKDGWGYSDGPPIVAGVVALMKSANPALTPRELKEIIVATAFMRDGFRVLNAEAAVQAAIQERK
jgi:subtilisin family serine protease